MELWKAATAASLLRNENGNRSKIISDYTQTHSDWMQGVMLWFDDEPRIGYSWFLPRVPAFYGIHPEEWGDAIAGQPLVPLLANESAGNPESDWSIDYTIRILDSMREQSLEDIVCALSEDEAYLFWQVALGESPPIAKRAMIRAVGGCTKYSTNELLKATAYTPFLEVIERAFRGDIPTTNPMEPDIPISPCPRYRQWKSITLPFPTTYVEVIREPRSYLHYTGTQGKIYTRSGKLMECWSSDHKPAIYEIKTDDDFDRDTMTICDILYLDSDEIWKQNYTKRKSMIDYDVVSITTMGELREIVRSLKEGERLRLIDDVPYYDDSFVGGFVMSRHPLRMPLLITQARKVNNIKVNVRLSALDGYTPVQVAEVWCPDDVGMMLRTHPRLGPVIGDVWTRMDDVGCIIDVAAYGIQTWAGHYHLNDPELLGIDSGLGFSDTTQLSDLLMTLSGE